MSGGQYERSVNVPFAMGGTTEDNTLLVLVVTAVTGRFICLFMFFLYYFG